MRCMMMQFVEGEARGRAIDHFVSYLLPRWVPRQGITRGGPCCIAVTALEETETDPNENQDTYLPCVMYAINSLFAWLLACHTDN